MISLGAYSQANVNQITSCVGPGNIILVADNDKLALELVNLGYTCIKRVVRDNQIDFNLTAEQNASNWYNWLLNNLNSNDFNKLYTYAVGFNECYRNNNIGDYAFLSQIEIALCNKLHAINVKYIWGSIGVGNISAQQFITVFKDINELADGCGYHSYLEPHAKVIENNLYYSQRPIAWINACRQFNLSVKPIFILEFGAYYQQDNSVDILKLLDDKFKTWDFPVSGINAFGVGLIGDTSNWNLTTSQLMDIKTHNNSVPPSIPPVQIQGLGAWVWYPSNLNNLNPNIKWLTVKYSDGTGFGDNNNFTVFRDNFRNIIKTINNINIFSWHYIYLNDPVNEAIAVAQGVADGAKAIILDVEYEAVNRLNQAVIFFKTLRNIIGNNVTICFAPDFRILVGNAPGPWNINNINLSAEPWPWDTFVNNCDYVMPQLYWTDFRLSVLDTLNLMNIFIAAGQKNSWKQDKILPIFPASASATDLAIANAYTKVNNIPGCSIWRFDDFNNWQVFNVDINGVLLGVVKQLFGQTNIAFNPDAALCKAWIKALQEGHYLGLPLGGEFDVGDYRFQQFQYNITWTEINNWGHFGYGAIS